MQVEFRECNTFDLWMWLEFDQPPEPMVREYLEEILTSWYVIGKLGGFNAENLQVQEAGVDISHMHYDQERAENSLMSLMHNMGQVEYQGNWARCWFDLGTSDALALDVLINTLSQFDRDYGEIHRLLIGGENTDWPLDPEPEDHFYQ